MEDPGWKIEDDGGLPGNGNITITVDGVDVTNCVQGYQVEHDRHGRARLALYVEPVDLTIVGDTEPVWVGLDGLPASVLRGALEQSEGGA